MLIHLFSSVAHELSGTVPSTAVLCLQDELSGPNLMNNSITTQHCFRLTWLIGAMMSDLCARRRYLLPARRVQPGPAPHVLRPGEAGDQRPVGLDLRRSVAVQPHQTASRSFVKEPSWCDVLVLLRRGGPAELCGALVVRGRRPAGLPHHQQFGHAADGDTAVSRQHLPLQPALPLS